LGTFSIIGIVLIMVVFFIMMFHNWIIFKQPSSITEEMKVYVRYDGFCSFCGKEIPETATFCPHCGHEQEISQ
jgi:hypothetical protein